METTDSPPADASCLKCGYPLRGLTSPTCPECGQHYDIADPTTFARRLPRRVRRVHMLVGLTIVITLGALPFSDTQWRGLVNLRAMAWLGVIVLGGLWMSFGPAAIGRTFVAIFLGRTIDSRTVATGIDVLARARRLAWAAGLLGTLLGVRSLLVNLDDPARIGPAIAYALLTLAYGIVLAEFVLGPCLHALAATAQQDRS